MGLLSSIFGGGNKPSGGKNMSGGGSGLPVYQPAPVNKEKVLDDLYQLAYDTTMDYYDKHSDDFTWLEDDINTRYARYYAMSNDQLRGAVNQRDPKAYYVVGDKLAQENRMQEAVPWFRVAAEAGVVDGMYGYGWCLVNGSGIQKNLVEGVSYLKKAAEAGLVYQACDALSAIPYEEISTVKPNPQEWVKWSAYSAYAAQGAEGEVDYMYSASSACLIAASMKKQAVFDVGLDRMNDPFTREQEMYNEELLLMAYYFERKALEAGLPPQELQDQHVTLAMLGESALFLKKPYAVPLLQVAADMGSDYAYSCLAWPRIGEAAERRLRDPQTVNSPYYRNMVAAIQRVINNTTNARERANALFGLAMCYEFGIGVGRNLDQAVNLIQQSAGMKFPFANHMLEMYMRGPDGHWHHRPQ